MTGTSHNASFFVTFTKNADDDADPDIRELQSHESLPRHTTEHETQDIQSDEPPPVKQLNGEVTRIGDIAFGGGMYCEVWEGEWRKGGGGKGNGGESVKVEKVSLSLAISILLIGLVGGLESTSNTQGA